MPSLQSPQRLRPPAHPFQTPSLHVARPRPPRSRLLTPSAVWATLDPVAHEAVIAQISRMVLALVHRAETSTEIASGTTTEEAGHDAHDEHIDSIDEDQR